MRSTERSPFYKLHIRMAFARPVCTGAQGVQLPGERSLDTACTGRSGPDWLRACTDVPVGFPGGSGHVHTAHTCAEAQQEVKEDAGSQDPIALECRRRHSPMGCQQRLGWRWDAHQVQWDAAVSAAGRAVRRKKGPVQEPSPRTCWVPGNGFSREGFRVTAEQ